ncbi:hypothetical protein IEN85_22495 [Pelagicoccus sp. NFK12]|uniref:Uncharacterized protein n=1 Tax=Pelagicoccus enzymogenes TaxID=2773457 RepID=A0A927FEF8_9BACT|nr:hypothetical protein [Pelagicoccus enzymogenes]MBD5782286.1 hypothetical protein [Pelagicoccus enzymogenes]MDQ8197819.1 hypothetical protein [Pelagicoccus enzymogenes]
MISFSNNRWLLVALGHYITLFFLSQANHYLSSSGIQVFALGMLISFSALELNYKQGLLSIAPVTLTIDSKLPLPFGFTFIASITLFTIAHVLRSRVRREITASALATSVLLNLASFGAYTFGAIRYLGGEAIHFGPLALNLLASTLVILALNRIFFDTQIGVLSIFGINLAEEQREAR